MTVLRSRSAARRGSTLIESALTLASFAILMAGIMELGFTGLVSNSISFAAQRAARYASVRGSASGHPAAVSDIQATAQQYASPLNPIDLTVTVTWTPNNNPGSLVEVDVSYSFTPTLLPLSATALTLKSKARQAIVQ
ncbi:MAG TPA: TadE family protein [Bryobacteraceae bacterium]|nr:TadE family protein [Bryobacteraceae bacterium]